MSEESATPAPSVPFLAKLKFIVIGLVVGLLAGGVGAGKVWWDMSSAVSEATQEVVVASDKAKTEVSSVQGKLDHAQGQARVLKARVAASKALFEFNRQNYGSAGDQLKMVRSHLAALDAGVHGLDAAAIESAKTMAAGATADAAGDLTTQADVVMATGKAIDALIK